MTIGTLLSVVGAVVAAFAAYTLHRYRNQA